MRSFVVISVRFGVVPASLKSAASCSRGLLPGSLLVLALACQAGGGAGSNGSGASNNTGASSSGGRGSGAINLPTGASGGGEAFAGGISSDSGGEITVSGEVKDVKLTLTASDGTQIAEPIWSVDDTKIGSISGDGVFHANGFVGGVVTTSATVGNSSVSVKITVNVDITDNAGRVSEAEQALLTAGAATPADAGYKFLYPQDGTVFPRGLAAPLLQLAGAPATTSYTTITAPYFSYKLFAGTSSPIRVTLPEPVWKGLTLTAGLSDDVVIAVTKSSGGQLSGPLSQKWRIAQASMKGIIYYNTYSSPLTDDPADVTKKGGILRIKAPDASAVVYHAGDSFDSYEFTGGETQSKPQYAEIRMVELADKTLKKLNALNGRDAKGTPSLRKKVWIAAIDVDHAGVPDPSHPAFFVPGQELEGGNMRAFGALAPCQPDGGACESGSDCCGGYCRQTSEGVSGAPVLVCIPPPVDECSHTDEPCIVAEDCCNENEICINARCTLRSPVR